MPTEANSQGLCLDKGYDYDEVRAIVKEFCFTAHIRARGEEAKAIKREAGFRARRWMDEPLSPHSRSLGETARDIHRHAAPNTNPVS